MCGVVWTEDLVPFQVSLNSIAAKLIKPIWLLYKTVWWGKYIESDAIIAPIVSFGLMSHRSSRSFPEWSWAEPKHGNCGTLGSAQSLSILWAHWSRAEAERSWAVETLSIRHPNCIRFFQYFLELVLFKIYHVIFKRVHNMYYKIDKRPERCQNL